MKLKVILESYDSDNISGVSVHLTVPEYDYIETGQETDLSGVAEFDLPQTFSDEMFVYIHVNGLKKWADYVPSRGDTIYIRWS